jgi:hypothetical protein
MTDLPQTITDGYPPREYTFTGEWQEVEQGVRKARRNRDVVRVPVYVCSSEWVLMMQYAERVVRTEYAQTLRVNGEGAGR